MNDTLSENINLPVIGGRIEAFFQINEKVIKTIFKEFRYNYGNPSEIQLKMNAHFGEWEKFNRLKKRSPQKVYTTNWRLIFECPGPDRRYNYGTAMLNPEKVIEMLESFHSAYKIMSKLLKSQSHGSYKKKIGELHNPTIEIFAENEKVLMYLWINSNSQKLAKTLKIDEVKQTVKLLNEIPQKAITLMESLRRISF